MADVVIARLTANELDACLDELVAVLDDAVESGASVGFVSPLDADAARAYWRARAEEADAGRRLLLVARDDGRVVGSVQLAFAEQSNARHRGEIQRLVVHRSAQRRGIGSALMRRLEAEARAGGRFLLVLNTRAGDPPEALYRALGYTLVGRIPDYAQSPDGSFNTTSIMYRRLGP